MKKLFLLSLGVSVMTVFSSCSTLSSFGGGGMDIGGAVSAGSDAVKAVSLSDQDVQKMALDFSKSSDGSNKLAPAGSKYSKRLAALTQQFKNEDGLNLNFRAYLSPTVNAFSLADGSIRVYSGLMDLMTDDELVFVIGHEIGHVKLGHSKQVMKVAYAASAARKGVAASGTKAALVASTPLGGMFESVVNSQFSQSEESDADQYGFKFLKKSKRDPKASVSALMKLAKVSTPHSFLSTHPAPEARAKKLESQL